MRWQDRLTRSRLYVLLASGRTEVVEFGAALCTVLYGLWFWLGPGTYGYSTSLAPLGAWLTEDQLGLLIALLGLPLLLGVLLDRPLLRYVGMCLNLVLWAFWVALIGQSSAWRAAVLPQYGLIVAAHFWLLVRAGYERRGRGQGCG